jgi:hypothetical protein
MPRQMQHSSGDEESSSSFDGTDDRPCVLIADDDTGLREVLRYVLEEDEGYRTERSP